MPKSKEYDPIQEISDRVGDFKALPDAIITFYHFLITVQADSGTVWNRYFNDKTHKLRELYEATFEAIRAFEPETQEQGRRKLWAMGWEIQNNDKYKDDIKARNELGNEINALIKALGAGIGQNSGVNTPKEKKRTVGAKKGA